MVVVWFLGLLLILMVVGTDALDTISASKLTRFSSDSVISVSVL